LVRIAGTRATNIFRCATTSAEGVEDNNEKSLLPNISKDSQSLMIRSAESYTRLSGTETVTKKGSLGRYVDVDDISKWALRWADLGTMEVD